MAPRNSSGLSTCWVDGSAVSSVILQEVSHLHSIPLFVAGTVLAFQFIWRHQASGGRLFMWWARWMWVSRCCSHQISSAAELLGQFSQIHILKVLSENLNSSQTDQTWGQRAEFAPETVTYARGGCAVLLRRAFTKCFSHVHTDFSVAAQGIRIMSWARVCWEW